MITHRYPFAGACAGLFVALALGVALAAQAQTDGDVVTDPGLDAGQVEVATSTDGTGGISGEGGTVTTGDASASTTVDNQLNETVITPDEPGVTNSSDITAETANDGVLQSLSTTTAETGSNEASGDGLSTVVTGTATAAASVVNVINTNIFNSVGLILFLNQLFGGAFDLRQYDLSFFFDDEAGASMTTNASGNPQCTLLTCLNSSEVNVLNTNDAVVTTDMVVRAETGENLASSTGASPAAGAFIRTGSAYAAGNLINMVNTNIINSSYLFLTFNNFGDLSEDIILPNDEFFGRLLARGGSAPEMNSSSYDVAANNTVDVVGSTTVAAETGDNLASSTAGGAGSISTGDAYAVASVYTDANSTYVGGTSVFFLFRIAGEWTGTVIGLPAGLTAERGYETYEQGGRTATSTVLLVTNGTAAASPQAPRANCDSNDGPVNNCFNSSSFLASSTNTALVENNVDVAALTGGNTALTASGTPQIVTGNAYAAANVINLINTNIVGRNWMMAMFNVLGDFSGDISFGDKPNLGEIVEDFDEVVVPSSGGGGGGGGSSIKLKSRDEAESPDITITKYASVASTSAPATVDYTIVVQNSKRAGKAQSATLTDTLTGPSGQALFARSWDLGTLVPGDYVAVSYSVQFAATSTPGIYSNTARLDAKVEGAPISQSTTKMLEIGSGLVLGAQSQCTALSQSLAPGARGAAVGALQRFLAGQGYELPATGYFGPMTRSAVSAFQQAHAAEILAPLGLSRPTGAVYASTLRAINRLSCGQ